MHSLNDEIDIARRDVEVLPSINEILDDVIASKWLLSGFFSLCVICALVIAFERPNVYRSSATLMVNDQGGGGLSGLAGQLGGLASLAGVPIGGAGSEKVTLALETLKSRKFIVGFVRKYEIEAEVIAGVDWDFKRGAIV